MQLHSVDGPDGGRAVPHSARLLTKATRVRAAIFGLANRMASPTGHHSRTAVGLLTTVCSSFAPTALDQSPSLPRRDAAEPQKTGAL